MGKHILVVDPEQQIRDLLHTYLTREGYTVTVAETSALALEILRKETIDVVITEIALGAEDGLKLLPQVKSGFPQVHVIILTGLGFVEDLMEEAQRKGAEAYISKVFPLDELILAIRRVTKTERPFETEQPCT